METYAIPKWVALEDQRYQKRQAQKDKSYEGKLASGQLSYEEICDHSRDKMEKMGTDRWAIGDDAALIETKYGDHTMQDFARDIGGNKSTIAGYHRVSKFYPNIIRRKLLDNLPNLTYSHYKDALRLKDLDAAIDWLDTVSKEGWSPDKAAYELGIKIGDKPDNPKPIPGKIEDVYMGDDGMARCLISFGPDDMAVLEGLKGSTVNIKTKQL